MLQQTLLVNRWRWAVPLNSSCDEAVATFSVHLLLRAWQMAGDQPGIRHVAWHRLATQHTTQWTGGRSQVACHTPPPSPPPPPHTPYQRAVPACFTRPPRRRAAPLLYAVTAHSTILDITTRAARIASYRACLSRNAATAHTRAGPHTLLPSPHMHSPRRGTYLFLYCLHTTQTLNMRAIPVPTFTLAPAAMPSPACLPPRAATALHRACLPPAVPARHLLPCLHWVWHPAFCMLACLHERRRHLRFSCVALYLAGH